MQAAAMADADGAVLAIDGIEAGYFPDVPILNGVRATIEAGEMVTIVGPNGAGKSTLVRVVIGLLPPWAGTVHLRARMSPAASPTRSSRAVSATSPNVTTCSRR